MSAAQFPLGTIWEAQHGRELVRFAVVEHKGHRFAQLWKFYRAADDWKHCDKGGTVPLWGLTELHAALGAYLALHAPNGAPGVS